MDYQATLYDPIYTCLGVAAVIVLDDSEATTEDLTVLDKTAGVDVGENVSVPTLIPAAKVRRAELISKGIKLDDLPRATLTFNDSAWKIKNFKPLPSPRGERDGQVLLMLTGQRPIESESES